MGEYGAFGFDRDEFDRVIREGTEGLHDLFERIGSYIAGPGGGRVGRSIFEDLSRRPRSAPATAGESGDGVWAVYTVDDDGGAHVEQVHPRELDALRANRDNVDPRRKVRFLPYGIAVTVLDREADRDSDGGSDGDSDAGSDEQA